MSTPRRPLQAGDGDARHGTLNGYSNHGCRCDACRAANTKAHRQWRETPVGMRRRYRTGRTWPLVPAPHGTYGAYQQHRNKGETQCEPCREAGREYFRQWRETPVGARNAKRNAAIQTETYRRLRTLHPDDYAAIRAEVRREYDEGAR